jgi:hypothetical protein
MLGDVLVPAPGVIQLCVETTCGTENPVQCSSSAEKVINAGCPIPAPRTSANGQNNSSPSSTLEYSAEDGLELGCPLGDVLRVALVRSAEDGLLLGEILGDVLGRAGLATRRGCTRRCAWLDA